MIRKLAAGLSIACALALAVSPGAAYSARKAGKRTLAVFLLNPDPLAGERASDMDRS